MAVASYKEIRAQIEDLKQQADAARASEKSGALDKIRSLIIEYKLLPADLGFVDSRKRPASTPVAAKYRDPASGKTWSGRGRAPLWLQGDDRTKYEISE